MLHCLDTIMNGACQETGRIAEKLKVHNTRTYSRHAPSCLYSTLNFDNGSRASRPYVGCHIINTKPVSPPTQHPEEK